MKTGIFAVALLLCCAAVMQGVPAKPAGNFNSAVLGCFSTDGGHFLVVEGGRMHLLKEPFKEKAWDVKCDKAVMAVAFMPDGGHFLALRRARGAGGKRDSYDVASFETATGKFLNSFALPDTIIPVAALEIGDGGKTFVILDRNSGAWHWPVALVPGAKCDEALIRRLVKELGEDSYDVRVKAAAEIMKIGRPALPALRKATKSGDIEIASAAGKLIIDIAGRPKNQFRNSKDIVNIRVFADGRLLVGKRLHDGVKLWEIGGATGVTTVNIRELLNAIALSQDGRWMAFDGAKSGVVLLSVNFDKGKFARAGFNNGMQRVDTGGYLEFSPDGKYLYTNRRFDRTVVVRSVPDLKVVGGFKYEGRLDPRRRHLSPRGDYFVIYDRGFRFYNKEESGRFVPGK